ncbi:MAG: class II fructose-bisphosphate aldolase [Chitinophagaceae bacterium]
MTAVSPEIFYRHCYGEYAIAAVNVFNMEQVHALFSAAQESQSPVIVQVTPAARNYAHPLMMLAMVEAAAVIYPGAMYALHLDHGVEDHIEAALAGHYTSVMIDASADDFNTNIARTKSIVTKAHANNIVVEAELGVLSGREDDHQVAESLSRYTVPQQAAEFVEKTSCDSLAVAVGTSHGAYKFSGGTALQFDVLQKIQERMPGYPLVLHGSSCIREADILEINRYGGKMNADARGVSDAEVQQAIAYGICKVNIATDLRLLWAKEYRKFFYEQPAEFDPIIPGKAYMTAYKSFIKERFEVLGSVGKTTSLKLSY